MLNSGMVLRVGVVLAASVSLGCKLGAVPVQAMADSGLAVSAATKSTPSVFSGQPKITGVKDNTPNDGMSHVQVRMTVDERPSIPSFHLENLPAPANWKSAMITLFSATANNAYVAATHSQTILKGSFLGVPLTATTLFPPLRPANDYIARCFILNDAGGTVPLRLAASLEKTNQTLDAGSNTINFNVQLNGNESNYSIVTTSSVYKNKVSDGFLVQGDQIDFNTGMDTAAPGIDHIDAVLTGAAYGGGSCVLGRVSVPADLSTFHWDSSIDAAGPGGTYVAANLVGGNLAAPVAGTIEFRAYHALDSTTAVGKVQIPVNFYQQTTVQVQVQ